MLHVEKELVADCTSPASSSAAPKLNLGQEYYTPLLKSCKVVENVGQDKIQQGPKFSKVVLGEYSAYMKRSPGEDKSVACFELLEFT